MAIVHENKFGWFLDDKLYFDKFYQKVQTQESSEVSFEVHPDIFNIFYPFMFDSQFQKYIDNLETSNKLETKEHDSTVPVHSRKRKRKIVTTGNDKKTKKLEEFLYKALKSFRKKLSKPHQLDLSDKGFHKNAPARAFQHTARQVHQYFYGLFHSEDSEEGDDGDGNRKNQVQIMELSNLSTEINPKNKYILNLSNVAKEVSLPGNQFFLFPAQCSFLLSDIFDPKFRLPDSLRYDCVVLDPPWMNKSVKRKRLYQLRRGEEMHQLPLRELCRPGSLVCVWLTNNKRCLKYLLRELFPSWRVQYLTTWYWLKVTKGLLPVLPFSSLYDRDTIKNVASADAAADDDAAVAAAADDDEEIGRKNDDFYGFNNNKKPYEMLVVGRFEGGRRRRKKKKKHDKKSITNDDDDGAAATADDGATPDDGGAATADDDGVEADDDYGGEAGDYGGEADVGDDDNVDVAMKCSKVIMSVPSAIHSHKPPLNDVLKRCFLSENSRCIELFARGLQTGWTSWGNEVFLLQNKDFFRSKL